MKYLFNAIKYLPLRQTRSITTNAVSSPDLVRQVFSAFHVPLSGSQFIFKSYS
jgi:hypothetical protein